jgi:hypothetical protein
MKHTLITYWTWTVTFQPHNSLCVVLQTIPLVPLVLRKDLLRLCRSQTPCLKGSRIYKSLSAPYTNIYIPSSTTRRHEDVDYLSCSFLDFVNQYQEVFLDLAFSSIVALAVRISPGVADDDFRSVLDMSISKELTASININPSSPMDYRVIFAEDPMYRFNSFSTRLPPNEDVASNTYSVFCFAREKLANMLVYPSCGRKTIGSKAAESFWKLYYENDCTFKHKDDGSAFDSPDVTPLDSLKLYEEIGCWNDGPVEMRTSWTYADVKPRVYFARGGDVLPASLFIQPIVNELIDMFPEVHRLNRFSPPANPLDHNDVEVIYDYSSFTSSCEGVVEFVKGLADFFRGVIVQTVDVRNGLCDMDLGDLFDRYNDECNLYANFDVSRVCTLEDDTYLLQHTCGMLGVEGNIFLATLLHGIHLRFISGLRNSKCVGDDARFHWRTLDGRIRQDDIDVLSWTLSSLGEINSDKLVIFEEGVDPLNQAYNYIKRPISRDEDIMVVGRLLVMPSLIPLLDLDDGFHTLLPSNTHPCRSTFKAIIRFLQLMVNESISEDVLSSDSFNVIVRHIRFLVREILKKDPNGEHSPFSRNDSHSGYRLPPCSEWGKVTYTDWLVGDLMYDEEVRVFQMGAADAMICAGLRGEVVVRETSRLRSFLVKMGYLRSDDIFENVSIRLVGEDVMRIYLEGRYRSTKTYTILEDIPTWYHMIQGI